MPLQLTNEIAGVLDNLRGLLAKPDTELELLGYDPAEGYDPLGKVLGGWIAYPKEGSDGRFIEIIVADTSSDLAEMMAKPSYARIGSLYYKINGVPEAPLAFNDAIRYWLIRCSPTGERKPT